MNAVEPTSEGSGFAGLMAGMGLFVIIGIPMVFFIWRYVNDILSGRFVAAEAALALGLLVLFLVFLRLLARRVRRWDTESSI